MEKWIVGRLECRKEGILEYRSIERSDCWIDEINEIKNACQKFSFKCLVISICFVSSLNYNNPIFLYPKQFMATNFRALLKTLNSRLFEILKPEFTIVNEDFKILK
jgi:hypothetical protein